MPSTRSVIAQFVGPKEDAIKYLADTTLRRGCFPKKLKKVYDGFHVLVFGLCF